jgi:two-component system, NarL family, nitrate/nitrite response regulator NarL
MIRVFHCDDSEAFTRLVELWLGDYDDIEHAGAAHSVAVALEVLPVLKPDVILLDTMGEPGSDGLLRSMRERAPDARVIVYSAYVGLGGEEVVGPGADAYLAKEDDETALVSTIRAVAGRTSGL